MTKKKQPKATPPSPQQVLVVFGLNENAKPRGARFTSDKTDQAGEAAVSMKLEIHEAKGGELVELAKKLPAGRIYARGKAFVPFIKKDLYDKLRAATGVPTKAATEDSVESLETPANVFPQDWESIGIGSVVLFHESLEDGWWEATVIERRDRELMLRFRDYPKVPQFTAEVSSVGLIYPRSE